VAAAVGAAAWSLARDHCGALIVLARRDAIAELVTPGVRLDGRVSVELLDAIFQKGSAVHDGAAIIEGDVVTSVGAILPLTQRPGVPAQYGTRHRAAMGLAERSDALVVVVSEERGEVTLMWEDRIQLTHDEAELVSALSTSTATRSDSSTRPLRALRPTDFRLPLLALALSASVWSLTFLLPGTSVRVRSVPLEFTSVPQGLTIAAQSADTVEVWFRGSDFVFDSVNLDSAVARCDLAAARAGSNVIHIPSDAIDLPPGLRVVGITPGQVTVRLTTDSRPAKAP